jgi:hypothetical protein
MSLSSDAIEDLITRHFDGSLSVAEERQLAAELAASKQARATLAAYMRLEGAAVQLGKIECLAEGDSKRMLPAARRKSPVHLKHARAANSLKSGWIAAAACLAFAALAAIYLTSGPRQNPPSVQVIAHLTQVGPGVTITRSDETRAAELNEALYASDALTLPGSVRATVVYDNEATTLDLSGGSAVRFSTGEKGKRVHLRSGRLEAVVAKQPAGQALTFTTPNAVAEVLGTKLALSAEPKNTRLEVSEGLVRFVSGTEAVEVAAQHFAEAKEGVKLAALPLEKAPASAVLSSTATAPALPVPTGDIQRVSTVEELTAAVRAAAPGQTILIAPGTYRLTTTLNVAKAKNLALRGATDNYNDVVLLGRGATVRGGPEQGIQLLDSQDIVIANLSLGEFRDNPLHLHGALGCARVRLYNVRCFDAATNFIHATDDGPNRGGVSDVTIEYCLFEYTRPYSSREFGACINILNGKNWVLRNCVFRNLPMKLAGADHYPAAILASNGASNTLCERNTFINCARAIAFGITPRKNFHDHTGGIIRNNMIYRDARTRGDTGVMVWDSPDTKVLHNTVILNGTYANAIEYRFAGSKNLLIANNLCDGEIAERENAEALLNGNITNAEISWLTDAPRGNLHLRSGAAAIDRGVFVDDCRDDFDGEARPQGKAPDVGADEMRAP